MKKLIAILLMSLSTHAIASIDIGSGKISSMPSEKTLTLSLDTLPTKFYYNIECVVESGGQGSISNTILHFGEDFRSGAESGGVYFDNKPIYTKQAKVDGHHVAEYRQIRTGNPGAKIIIDFVEGDWAASVHCVAYAATGLVK